MFKDAPYALMTMGVAILFSIIYLFGGKADYKPGQRGRRRFLSFAAGISVGYVFVHVLPGLGAIHDLQMQSQSDFHIVFPQYSVYLWTMVGFLIFYGLEVMVVKPGRVTETGSDDNGGAISWKPWSWKPWSWKPWSWKPWVHIGGFALYAWLLTYLMIWTGRGSLAIFLYAVAMGMHLFTITCGLSSRYKMLYDRRGAILLSLASMAGWAFGLFLKIPDELLLDLVAVVAGGVIVNAAIAELPKEKEGRYWAFLAGAFFYTALLMTLSHFEHGG